MTKEKSGLELKILEAYTRDVGRGVARLDYDTMDKSMLSTGDIIKIIGKNNTLAKALPLYPSDEGKAIIRIDGLIRENLESGIGQVITIEKVIAKPCTWFTVKPLESIPLIDERYIADAMEGMPIIRGTKFKVPYFGGRLKFLVLKMEPEDGGIIVRTTACKLVESPESEEFFEINEILEAQRKTLVDEMKKALKSKQLDNLDPILEKINKIDYTIQSVRNILEGKKTDVTLRLEGKLTDTLREAVENWENVKVDK